MTRPERPINLYDLLHDSAARCPHKEAVVFQHNRKTYHALKKNSIPIRRRSSREAGRIYTSGTKGKPKGAMLSHGNILHSVLNYEKHLSTNNKTVTLLAVPMFHVTGLIGQMFHMVRVGGKSVILPRYQTTPFIQTIEKEGITFLFNVPAIYQMLVSTCEKNSFSSFKGIQVVAYGGAPMNTPLLQELRKWFPNANLHNTYGATETSSPTAIMPQVYLESKIEAVGKPVQGVEVKIITEDNKECAYGEIGELWVKGPMVIPRYWNNEKANKTSFEEGYWKTGDYACLDQDGFLYIKDRKKDMINRGGEKIYSIEVESVLLKHPDIKEAAVKGAPHKLFGECVEAFVVPENRSVEKEKVLQFVAQHLADYKVPEHIHLIDELARNPGGKVMKHLLTNEKSTKQ
ncbi:class I adenylate-forming enzyme family protein [Alteribacillus sp. JSM 102045]|uniref:class I adenylate-forming enzyme family protein n=1 Tax=Alteribacillus sp. JSM 102045 TaxID=1562101 RepID=UPI0035BEB65F